MNQLCSRKKMKIFWSLILVGIVVSVLAGCGEKYDQEALENKIAKDWRYCKWVRPEQLLIEESSDAVVRYSYVLKMVVDGMTPGVACYEPDKKMLEALANKTLYQIKAGDEIPVTQEISLR